MAQKKFRCRGCQKMYRQRVVEQQYCGGQACQQKRKNQWSRQRYAADADFRLTAKESTKSWLAAQGGAAKYYRKYRKQRNSNENQKKNSNGSLSTICANDGLLSSKEKPKSNEKNA